MSKNQKFQNIYETNWRKFQIQKNESEFSKNINLNNQKNKKVKNQIRNLHSLLNLQKTNQHFGINQKSLIWTNWL